jgi:putative FmdB family regulatory protein
MPIYEYVCTACDHRADILQGINDPGPKFCPSCGREGTMRKQFAPPTIHYKGSGWAKKDRGGSSASRRAGGTSGSADTKTEAKSPSDSSPTSEGSGGSASGESHATGAD